MTNDSEYERNRRRLLFSRISFTDAILTGGTHEGNFDTRSAPSSADVVCAG